MLTKQLYIKNLKQLQNQVAVALVEAGVREGQTPLAAYIESFKNYIGPKLKQGAESFNRGIEETKTTLDEWRKLAGQNWSDYYDSLSNEASAEVNNLKSDLTVGLHKQMTDIKKGYDQWIQNAKTDAKVITRDVKNSWNVLKNAAAEGYSGVVDFFNRQDVKELPEVIWNSFLMGAEKAGADAADNIKYFMENGFEPAIEKLCLAMMKVPEIAKNDYQARANKHLNGEQFAVLRNCAKYVTGAVKRSSNAINVEQAQNDLRAAKKAWIYLGILLILISVSLMAIIGYIGNVIKLVKDAIASLDAKDILKAIGMLAALGVLALPGILGAFCIILAVSDFGNKFAGDMLQFMGATPKLINTLATRFADALNAMVSTKPAKRVAYRK